MKRTGFTLIELLVVMLIMGMLTMVAIGGYSAIQRGMKQRGTLDVVRGLVVLAQQRANIDRRPVQVYLFDELVRPESDTEPAVVSGVAVAVASMGRISGVGDAFFDEFSDPEQCFPLISQNGSASAALRLYNMRDGSYANVAYGVIMDSRQEEDPEGNTSRTYWRYGYKKTSGSGNFKVGDEYGREFSIVRLPNGYTFSSNPKLARSNIGWQSVGKPIQLDADNTSPRGVTVYERQVDGSFSSIGSTNEVKDDK